MTHEEDAPLPNLADAMLDPATLDQLFFDIASEAELVTVLAKGGDTAHASEDGLALETARSALLDGTIPYIQIRYRYRGSEWWDTLMRTRQGVRLVRIEHPYP